MGVCMLITCLQCMFAQLTTSFQSFLLPGLYCISTLCWELQRYLLQGATAPPGVRRTKHQDDNGLGSSITAIIMLALPAAMTFTRASGDSRVHKGF